MRKWTRRAFTLIELMIVIIMLGFLASMAIPTFNKTMRRSREKKARAMLELANRAQRYYRLNEGRYYKHPADPQRFDGDGGSQGLTLFMDDPNARSNDYTYTIDSVAENPDTFEIRAAYSRDNTTLMIDETGTIVEE